MEHYYMSGCRCVECKKVKALEELSRKINDLIWAIKQK